MITSLPFEKYVIGQNSSPLNGLKLVIMSQFNCCDSDWAMKSVRDGRYLLSIDVVDVPKSTS